MSIGLSVISRDSQEIILSGVLFTAILSGCGALHPGYPGGDLVGHVGVSGPVVTLQTEVMREPAVARNGAAVREGDRIATGAASSAIVEYYNGGGKLQLDADSAARFRKERTAPGVCSLVDLARGQAWIRADAGCGVELRALDYVVRINGRANVVLNDERFEISVISGRAALLQPRAVQLAAGQTYTDAAAHDAQVSELEKSASQARLAWLDPYAFQGWCCYGRNVMPAARGQCLPPDFSFDETTLTMQCKHKDGAFTWLGRLRSK
jgi:hypothetical protein